MFEPARIRISSPSDAPRFGAGAGMWAAISGAPAGVIAADAAPLRDESASLPASVRKIRPIPTPRPRTILNVVGRDPSDSTWAGNAAGDPDLGWAGRESCASTGAGESVQAEVTSDITRDALKRLT